MGHLITRQNLVPSPAWYFTDAYYSWDARRWVYKFPSDNFPYYVAIHYDDIAQHGDRKVTIRRWIEGHVEGPVLLEEIDKSYRVYYSEEKTWERSYEQTNVWWVFYFEVEEEALLFKLAFSEYVKEMTDLHPTRNHEYEKTSYYKTY